VLLFLATPPPGSFPFFTPLSAAAPLAPLPFARSTGFTKQTAKGEAADSE